MNSKTETKWKQVTKEELHQFVTNYPTTLEWDVSLICDPPLGTYNDFSKGNWPESVVAKIVLDDPPRGPGRSYYLLDDSHLFEGQGSGI